VNCERGEVADVEQVGLHFTLHRISLLRALGPNPFGEPSESTSDDAAFCSRIHVGKGPIAVATGIAVFHVDERNGAAYTPGVDDGDTIDATRVPAELPFESPLRRSDRPHRARPVAPFAVLVCERQVPCQTRFDAGIPEFRTVERRDPRAFDEAHESVRTYACRLIAVHSQDQNRRVARDPFRSRTSRHCNFGFAICDHVPAECRHLRIVRYPTDTSVPERSFATTRMVADRYLYAAVIAGFSSLGHSAFAKPTDLRVSRWSSTPPMLRE